MTITPAYVTGYRAGWTAPSASTIEPPADYSDAQRDQFSSGFVTARVIRSGAWIHEAGRA